MDWRNGYWNTIVSLFEEQVRKVSRADHVIIYLYEIYSNIE
jgi:hypothetical protein